MRRRRVERKPDRREIVTALLGAGLIIEPFTPTRDLRRLHRRMVNA